MKKVFLIALIFASVCAVAAEIDPELEDELEDVNGSEKVDVLAPVDTDLNESELTGANFSSESVEVEEKYEKFDTVLLEAKASEIENISEKDFIEGLEPDYELEALLAESSIQIGSRIPSDKGNAGENVSVAVMDSGVAEHPSLELAGQRDFTGEGLGDENGHGTHVAGIVASTHSEYRGVAYEADLYDVKVLNSEGSGRGSNMLRGLDYIIRNDIDVAVMSLGTTLDNCNGNDALSRAVGEAVRSGVVVTASAGNAGPGNSTLTAPGCSERALTVGSVDKSDRIATYSSRGPTSDGRVKPDVVAPGSSIVSTGRDSNFVSMSGTSMAAPQVAGQAALLVSEDSDKRPGEVKDTVKKSADDIGYHETAQGAGRINVPQSLNSTAETQALEERPSFLTRLWIWFADFFGF